MAMKQKGQKTYKTMQGKTIDMEMLRKKNELVPAVGNAKVNARGDELGPGGKIVRKREEIVNDYYKNTQGLPDETAETRAAEEAELKAKAEAEANAKAEAEAEAKSKTETKTEQKKTRASTKSKTEQPKGVKPSESEAAEWDDDEWVEDKDGNFVKKGE